MFLPRIRPYRVNAPKEKIMGTKNFREVVPPIRSTSSTHWSVYCRREPCGDGKPWNAPIHSAIDEALPRNDRSVARSCNPNEEPQRHTNGNSRKLFTVPFIRFASFLYIESTIPCSPQSAIPNPPRGRPSALLAPRGPGTSGTRMVDRAP